MFSAITGVSNNGKRKRSENENSLLLLRMHRITEEASGQEKLQRYEISVTEYRTHDQKSYLESK